MRSWYVAHRSSRVDELDQEEIRNQLQSFIKRGAFPHAMLFAGPKGIGKTSSARLIAKILNCEKRGEDKKLGEPCNECSSCKEITQGFSMSVIELDGASHRGIDDIRSIRETVKLSAPGKFKVYIIDEAHMLTTEAFNALLKTLEEPPDNVIFILATTAIEKIPETIRSRATTLQFKQANEGELRRSLARIAEREKLKIDDEAFEAIVKHAGGSFRDAIKILEQVAVGKHVNYEAVNTLLNVSGSDPRIFLDLIIQKDALLALSHIQNIVSRGGNIRQFIVQVISELHEILLTKLGVGKKEAAGELDIPHIKQLVDLLTSALESMRISPIPELPLELMVVEWCGDTNLKFKVQSSKLIEEQKIEKPESENLQQKTYSVEVGESIQISNEIWHQFISQVKPLNHSISALLKSARPLSFDGKVLTLCVFYKFHKDKLEEAAYRKILEDVACDVLGVKPVKVAFLLGDKPKEVVEREHQVLKKTMTRVDPEEELMKTAEEIFVGDKGQSH